MAEVWESYRPLLGHEWRTEWALVLLYRPLSLLLTPPLAAAGVPPNAVTLLGLACALLLPWCALVGGSSGALLVGGLGIACCVLDCVDGTLARVTGRVSPEGARLDLLTDLAYRALLYTAIGLLAGAVLAGAACAVLALAARAVRLRTGLAAPESDDVPLTWRGRVYAFLSGLDHLTPVLVLLPLGADRHAWLLGWLAVYSAGDLAVTLARLRQRPP